MKTSILHVLIGLCLVGTISCRDKTNPDPVVVVKPENWKLLPMPTAYPIIYMDVTPNNLLVNSREGIQRIDSTGTITGTTSLTITNVFDFDYPVQITDNYTLVYSYRYKSNQQPVVSIYDYSTAQQPLLTIPVDQFIRPVAGHLRYCFDFKNCEDEYLFTKTPYTYFDNYYGSGFLDANGNLFLAFYTATYQGTYFYHYYKFKLVADTQNKPSLQFVSDYLYQLNAGTYSTIFNIGTQSLISYSSDQGGKLVRINPAGADQTIFQSDHRIDNVFGIANTLYLVASASVLPTSIADLWSSTDDGATWQKTKTLTPIEKAFFMNCSTNNGLLPLLAVVDNVPMRKNGVDVKIDTLVSPAASVKKLVRLKQRYFLWAKDSVYYSDNPPVVSRH